MEQKHSYWQKETEKYDRPHSRLVLIADILREYEQISSILDVGGGRGTLARLLGQNYEYLSLDISGSQEVKNTWPRVEYCDFDHLTDEQARNLPSFDALVISGLLDYLEDWKGFLNLAVSNWLNPNGILLISFINSSSYEKFSRLRHPLWRNTFTLPGAMEQLKNCKVNVERVYPFIVGHGTWELPLVKFMASLASNQVEFNRFNHLWVRQFLCVGHKFDDTE